MGWPHWMALPSVSARSQNIYQRLRSPQTFGVFASSYLASPFDIIDSSTQYPPLSIAHHLSPVPSPQNQDFTFSTLKSTFENLQTLLGGQKAIENNLSTRYGLLSPSLSAPSSIPIKIQYCAKSTAGTRPTKPKTHSTPSPCPPSGRRD